MCKMATDKARETDTSYNRKVNRIKSIEKQGWRQNYVYIVVQQGPLMVGWFKDGEISGTSDFVHVIF